MSTLTILLLVATLALFAAGSYCLRRVEGVMRSSSPGFEFWLCDNAHSATGLGTLICAASGLTLAWAIAGSETLRTLLLLPFGAIGFLVFFSALCGLMMTILTTLEFLGGVITFRRDLRDDWSHLSWRAKRWLRDFREDWSQDRAIGLLFGGAAVAVSLTALAIGGRAYWPILVEQFGK